MVADKITRKYEITASPDVMKKFERVMAVMQVMSAVGSSRGVYFGHDGDGPDRFEVAPRSSVEPYFDEAGEVLDSGKDIQVGEGGYHEVTVEEAVRSVASLLIEGSRLDG